MKKLKFKAELMPATKSGKTCYITVPFDIKEVWGTKASVKVKAKVDKLVHRGLITPYGNGIHYMGLRKDLMAELGKFAGDTVDVTLEVDTEERTIDVPDDLKKLLAKNPKEKNVFESLSHTHRKEYVQWITSAKKEETRKRRLEKTIEMIREKHKK